MKYIGSEQHKQNAKKARAIGSKIASQNAKQIREKYYSNPKLCIECSGPIDFYKRKNCFCSKSCATSYNNKKRGLRSDKTKQKISQSLQGRTHNRGNGHESETKYDYNKIEILNCKVCEKIFVAKVNVGNRKGVRKTCSEECRVYASTKERTYQNGSRKPEWYFNKWENKKVLLESSWEKKVAEKLDEKQIRWIRPKHIKWEDSTTKQRYYFPDFYLIDYNLYLDPKNPYCMTRDKEKMKVVSKEINVVYGSLEKILECIEKI